MAGVRWDVFCRVVDNYGDAGVCWRLSRQLAAEHGVEVTLWIEGLPTLQHLEPCVDAKCAVQACAGVTVRRLDDAATPPALPDVVVEGFGCGLPPFYAEAMAAGASPPVWINLEYLSTEPWAESVHGLASVHPQLALTRYFWFPGFGARTGGLIRESGLLETRDAWQETEPVAGKALRIVLFCYPNRALPALFDAWSESDEAVVCTVPEGVATAALDRWLHGDVPHAGQSVVRGRLTLEMIPFATQDGFDRLLWSSDVNFVRGEDSFVRAQWAGRPFVWQPYPQDQNAHRLKLDAFIAHYLRGMPADRGAAAERFWQAFNGEDGSETVAAWPAFREALPGIGAHALAWVDQLCGLPELTSNLVEFTRLRL